nr:hypothetical protein [uncultured Prevotella sp.]
MNKKVYKQPQIFYIPLQTESLLQTLSKVGNEDKTGGNAGGGVTTDPNNPNGGAGDLSKEHWGSIDSWDSWE